MNAVAPSRRESARSARDVSAGSRKSRLAARSPWTVGRGRSVGSSSKGGAPASRPRHQASCASSTSPESQARCQTA